MFLHCIPFLQPALPNPPNRKNYYLLVSTFISVIGNLTAGDTVYTPGSPFLHPYYTWNGVKLVNLKSESLTSLFFSNLG